MYLPIQLSIFSAGFHIIIKNYLTNNKTHPTLQSKTNITTMVGLLLGTNLLINIFQFCPRLNLLLKYYK